VLLLERIESVSNQPKVARNEALDGIRMVAVTLVVLSHTNILNQGGLGNAIFFCLSGFLAALPFVQDGERRYLSAQNTLNYYFSRLFRILPLYYFILISVKWLTGNKFFESKTVLLQNMIFTDCYGHLWFLQQEMVMYLILPFLMILMAVIKSFIPRKYNDAACVIVLLFITQLTWKFLTPDIFYLRGNGTKMAFRIWQFTVGMAAAYLYRIYVKSGSQWDKHRGVRIGLDILASLLLIGCVLSSSSVLGRIDKQLVGFYVGWRFPLWCSSLAGVLILCLLVNPTGFVAKLLSNKILVVLGRISFGIYLVHFFFLPYVSLGSKYKSFVFIYAISACVAYVLHIFIEKPCGIFAKTKSIKQFKDYYKNLKIL
jgi:peptidoglycan/LPS O-acetylase OafA/YrhL